MDRKAVVVAVLLLLPALPADAGPDGADGVLLVGLRRPLPLAPGDLFEGAVVREAPGAYGFAVVAAADPDAFAARARGHPAVAWVEPEGRVVGQWVPNDPLYRYLQYAPKRIVSEAAWDVTLGSTAVTVAVVDSGIRSSHPDFPAEQLLPGFDYIDNDTEPQDTCDHGTAVAGVVAGGLGNDRGMAGMGRVRLVPLRVLTLADGLCEGTFSHVARAIRDAADQGADIILLSLGTAIDSSAIRDAVRYAWGLGTLLVAAAGNTNGGGVLFPAKYPEVVAVGATDSADAIASFSAMGPEIAVTAPGVSVMTANSAGSYATKSGTSLAAPHVAGVAALMLSVNASLPAKSLRSFLNASAQDRGAPGKDDAYGWGLLSAAGAVARADATVNHAPVIVSFGHDTMKAGTSFFKSFRVLDPDGGTPVVGLDPLPPGATFGPSYDAEEYAFRWTPTLDHLGTWTMTLSASDGEFTTAKVWRLTVVENLPPVAVAQGPAVLEVGQGGIYSSMGSHDPDGTIFSWTWRFLDPAGTVTTVQASSFSRAWSATGSALAELTVRDALGATATTNVTTLVDDHIVVALTLPAAVETVGAASGVVEVRFNTGEAAPGASVILEFRHGTFGGVLGPRIVAGTTGADGTLAFDVPADVSLLGARIPGDHTLSARASVATSWLGNAEEASAAGSYSVSPV